MIVGSSKDAEVIRGCDGGAVLGGNVADSGRVSGQGSPVDIVACRGTSEETLMADYGIDVGGGALEKIEEGTTVETGVLEVGIELSTLGSGGREEVEETLELQALGNGIGSFDLGIEDVGGVPRLGKGETWTVIKH